MYEQTFLAQRYGYGAAVAVVLLALMSGIIATLLWHMFRRERP
jgi:ABC-type sugar transport system permease subunit